MTDGNTIIFSHRLKHNILLMYCNIFSLAFFPYFDCYLLNERRGNKGRGDKGRGYEGRGEEMRVEERRVGEGR